MDLNLFHNFFVFNFTSNCFIGSFYKLVLIWLLKYFLTFTNITELKQKMIFAQLGIYISNWQPKLSWVFSLIEIYLLIGLLQAVWEVLFFICWRTPICSWLLPHVKHTLFWKPTGLLVCFSWHSIKTLSVFIF